MFGWQVTEMPEMDYVIVTTGQTGDQGPTEPGYINSGMSKRLTPIDASARQSQARQSRRATSGSRERAASPTTAAVSSGSATARPPTSNQGTSR